MHYFFSDMINIKYLDLSQIKIDEKSYKNICIHHIGYVTIKDLRYATVTTANSLNLTIRKINGYIEESNRNKHLKLVPNDKSQNLLKRSEILFDKQLVTQTIMLKKI